MKDLTGEKFGRLTVLELGEKRRRKRGRIDYYWLCLCSCGNKKVIRAQCLIYGDTKSCGCYKREVDRKRKLLKQGEAAFNQILNNYKQNAKNRGLAFVITRKKTKEIMGKDCYYCGSPPSNLKKSKYNSGDFIYNGIDRINNLIGYTEENVVPCCGMCNHAKDVLSEKDFLNWIKKIYEFKKLENQ